MATNLGVKIYRTLLGYSKFSKYSSLILIFLTNLKYNQHNLPIGTSRYQPAGKIGTPNAQSSSMPKL